MKLTVKEYIDKKFEKLVHLIIDKLIKSLGDCLEGNEYEIVPDKDGRWWINHKVVGSGEPLKQWIESELSK